MAKSRKRENDQSPEPETTSPLEGREAIHGSNEDYGDRVAQRAYELYLARGAADGLDFDDWIAAERELATSRRGDPRE